jgi:hypothetical protein
MFTTTHKKLVKSSQENRGKVSAMLANSYLTT